MRLLKAKFFPFGSHIKGNKFTDDSQIAVFPTPKTVYICVSQHIGAPANPIVNANDEVKKGQLIAEGVGAVSANVFSSVSGTVTDVCDITNGLGQTQKYVVIQSDGKDEQVFLPQMPDYEPSSLLERVKFAGIVGLGGAGFPTAVKLSPKNKLDVLLINGAECEPYLTCDHRLILEHAQEIYKGAKYCAQILGVDRIIIGIESNKPLAIKAFSEFPDIDIVVLKKQYPMGSEKHLIYCATGRKVPLGKMPFDVGVCVQNVKTLYAIYNAIELNKPLTENVITVSGKGVTEPKNLIVPIGTPYSELIEFCGGKAQDVVKVVAGGPMMGKSLISLNHYTKKTDSGILCLKRDETDLSKPTNCINCGVCARNCPMRLMPMYIESYALSDDYKNAEKYGAMNCIECGLCAYNCPAKRALTQSISMAKIKIKESKK